MTVDDSQWQCRMAASPMAVAVVCGWLRATGRTLAGGGGGGAAVPTLVVACHSHAPLQVPHGARCPRRSDSDAAYYIFIWILTNGLHN
jgi:hypothetical protein